MKRMRYLKSKKLFNDAFDIVAQNRKDLDIFPCYFKKAKGFNIWDYDNNKFTDLTCSRGAIILGHAHSIVDTKVIDRITKGGNILFTQLNKEKVSLAKLLKDRIPSAERSLFFKTGSEATSAAIRIARLKSKKKIILTSGYHGWHDWSLVMFEKFKSFDQEYIFDFEYNIQKMEKLIFEWRNDIAAIIISPEPCFFSSSHIKQICDIANRNNIIIIFDEVKTGFRFTQGGYQELIGTIPDMSVFSKGLANGYSISALVGKKEVMIKSLETHLWGTFHSEMIPLVAALETQKILKEENVIRHINMMGNQLIIGLKKLFIQYGVIAEIFGTGSIFHIIFDDISIGESFFKENLFHGVLFFPFDNQMICHAIDNEEVNEILKRVNNVLNNIEPKTKRKKVRHSVISKYTISEFGGYIEELQ